MFIIKTGSCFLVFNRIPRNSRSRFFKRHLKIKTNFKSVYKLKMRYQIIIYQYLKFGTIYLKIYPPLWRSFNQNSVSEHVLELLSRIKIDKIVQATWEWRNSVFYSVSDWSEAIREAIRIAPTALTPICGQKPGISPKTPLKSDVRIHSNLYVAILTKYSYKRGEERYIKTALSFSNFIFVKIP